MFDKSARTLKHYVADVLLHQAGTRQLLRRFLAAFPRWLLPSRNWAVTALLLDVIDQAAAAQDKPALIKALEPASRFGRPIAYDEVVYKVLAVLGSIALVVVALLYLLDARGDGAVYEAALMLIAVVPIGLPVALLVAEEGLIGVATFALYERALEIDSNILPKIVDGASKAKQYGTEFREFRRGTASHTIKLMQTVNLPLRTGKVECEYYHQYYVDYHVDSKGNRVEEGFHRYGLIVPFPAYSELTVGNSGGLIAGVEWKTESAEFNRWFKVFAADRQQAAHFLQPAVILAFLTIRPTFTDMCVEIGDRQRLCLSFTDADLLDVSRTADITDPNALSRVLETRLVPAKLSQATVFLAKLFDHISPQ